MRSNDRRNRNAALRLSVRGNRAIQGHREPSDTEMRALRERDLPGGPSLLGKRAAASDWRRERERSSLEKKNSSSKSSRRVRERKNCRFDGDKKITSSSRKKKLVAARGRSATLCISLFAALGTSLQCACSRAREMNARNIKARAWRENKRLTAMAFRRRCPSFFLSPFRLTPSLPFSSLSNTTTCLRFKESNTSRKAK